MSGGIRGDGSPLARWPVLRQLRARDLLGLGLTAQSKGSAERRGRIADAEHTVRSVCPHCAVGCGQLVYVAGDRVVQIEGDPDSPISRGRLCPKGAASEQLVNHSLREYRVKYRRLTGPNGRGCRWNGRWT
jgi:formate dehydrogenase major subunit